MRVGFESPLFFITTKGKTAMAVNETIESLITPVCENMGYDVVRIAVSGGERRKVLQIMIERKDARPMTVEDCASVSRALSPVLDEKDPIDGNYSLEVSSPGIDRPLVKLADFERFRGFEAKVESDAPINGRKRFTGRLQGVDGENVVVLFDGESVSIPFVRVAKAKLVITDELLAAAAASETQEG